MSFLGSLFKILTFGLFSLALKALAPKTPKLSSNTGKEQVYDTNSQQNVSKLGDAQAVLYGRVWRYPALSAQPWTSYDNNDQLLHLRMRVTVGIASVLQLRIGKTSISSFPGTQVQLCRPGESMTLFPPNVYQNEQVQTVEIAGGALLRTTYSGQATLGGTGHESRIDTGPDGFFGQYYGAFAGARVGGTVTLTGSPSDDGTYTITNVEPDNLPKWIEVDHIFTSYTGTVSLGFDAFDLRDNDAPQSKQVNVVYDHTLSTIGCAPDGTHPNDLKKFQVGDLIACTGELAGTNRYVNFTVLAKLGDGNTLVVNPAPDSGTALTDVVLVRRYQGGYAVCPPGDVVDRIGIDLAWTTGIGNINPKSGGIDVITMRFDVQWRPIDGSGQPLDDWTSFSELAVSDKSRKPYRRSFEYTLPAPCRAEVRVALVSKDNTSDNILDTVQWTGARGYIVARAGEYPEIDQDSTTLNVIVRASGALAAGDDRKVNGQFQRWLETWDPVTGWGPEVPTQSVIWAALDKARGRYTARGRQIPDAQINLPAFAAMDAVLAARGDEFNGSIEALGNLRENLNTILRLGRCELRYDWVGAQLSVYRDQPDGPVQMFTDLNSSTSGYRIARRTSNDATGVQATYQEPNANEERTIGIGDTDAKPIKLDLRNGCTSRAQAWREVQYEWAVERFRKRPISISAEMEPVTLRYGDRLLLQSAARGWGQAAEVVSAEGLTLKIWPPLDWTGSGFYAVLRSPTGTPGDPIPCARGAADDQLVLSRSAGIELTGDASGEQRTQLILGRDGSEPVTVIVNGVTWSRAKNGGHQAKIDGTLDDARVHDDTLPVPADAYPVVVYPPALAITGLALSASGTVVSVSWDALPAALIYEVEWQYSGAIFWTTVSRGTLNSARFSVTSNGTVAARVRAFGEGGTVGDYAVSTVDVMTGGGGALAVFTTPTSLYARTTSSSATTPSCTSSASGGHPPYAFHYELLTGDGTLLPTAADSNMTAFRAQGLLAGESREATARCRVIDADGTVAYGPTISAQIDNYSTGGGGGATP